jgi:hypothetical protein
MGELRPTIVRARLQPWLISSGAQANLYLAGGGDRCPYHFGGQDYKAGLGNLPRFKSRLGWDEDGWTGGVIPTVGELEWSPSMAADHIAYSTNYHWKDAPILVEVGEEGNNGAEPTAWTTVLTGIIGGVSASDGALRFTVGDLSARLDKPVISTRFAGTGGIEGPSEAKERPKRRSWGKVFNVECRILDKANSVWEFGDPAFQATSVEDLRDMGRSASPAPTVLAWQGSVAATFAALQSSIPVPGSGVVAPSIQCVKWWTTPVGPLTVDITGEGGAVSAPYLAQAILASLGGGVTISDAERNAAAALRPDTAGIHIGDERLTAAQALDQLLLGTSLLWVLNPSGVVNLRAITLSSPVETLTSLQVSRLMIFPPTKTRRVGYKRNYRPHNDSEISAVLELGTDVTGGGGGNELLDNQFGSTWSYSLGLARLAANATGGYALGDQPFFLEVSPSTTTQRDATSAKVAIQAGQRYYFEAKVQRGTTLGSGSQLLLFGEWFNAAGTSLGVLTGKTVVPGDLVAGAVPKAFRFSEVAPANATHIRFKVRSPALASSSGTFRVEAPRIQAYEFEADVSSSITGATPVVIRYESDGATPQSGEIPRDSSYRLFRNGVDVTEASTWDTTPTVLEGTATVAMSNTATTKGVLTVSALGSATAKVRLSATYNGLERTFDIVLQRQDAAPSQPGGAGAGTNATDTSLANSTSTNSASPSVVSDELTVVIGTGITQARLIANLQFNPTSGSGTSRSAQAQMKVQWWNGAAWADVNSYVTGSPGYNYSTNPDPESGEITVTSGGMNFNVTKTGLVAGASEKFRFVAYKSTGSGTGNTLAWTGTVQAKGDGS